MKKTYSKPDIMFESFKMCVNVAAGCELVTNLPSTGSCGYPIDRTDKVVWAEGINGCNTTPSGKYDSICYHIPSDSNNLFNS